MDLVDIARAPYLFANQFHKAARFEAAYRQMPIGTFYKKAASSIGKAALGGALRLAGPAGSAWSVYDQMQGPKAGDEAERAAVIRQWARIEAAANRTAASVNGTARRVSSGALHDGYETR